MAYNNITSDGSYHISVFLEDKARDAPRVTMTIVGEQREKQDVILDKNQESPTDTKEEETSLIEVTIGTMTETDSQEELVIMDNLILTGLNAVQVDIGMVNMVLLSLDLRELIDLGVGAGLGDQLNDLSMCIRIDLLK